MCGVICESIKERMEKLSGGLPPTESISWVLLALETILGMTP